MSDRFVVVVRELFHVAEYCAPVGSVWLTLT